MYAIYSFSHPAAYPTVSVRLVGGVTAAEGRVEVNYGGTWGTVCDDVYWGLNDATVVCSMLGYSSVRAAHVKYGEGSGNVWMSNLACNGSESSISECPHIGWGETSCIHSQDAGVTCGSECCLFHGIINFILPNTHVWPSQNQWHVGHRDNCLSSS